MTSDEASKSVEVNQIADDNDEGANKNVLSEQDIIWEYFMNP